MRKLLGSQGLALGPVPTAFLLVGDRRLSRTRSVAVGVVDLVYRAPLPMVSFNLTVRGNERGCSEVCVVILIMRKHCASQM